MRELTDHDLRDFVRGLVIGAFRAPIPRITSTLFTRGWAAGALYRERSHLPAFPKFGAGAGGGGQHPPYRKDADRTKFLTDRSVEFVGESP